jgi:hypothetical protein
MTIQNARSNTAGNVPPGSVDGQFLINQADDVLYTHKPDGTTRRFLLPKRRGIADSLVTIGPSETYIGISSLTASRAVALPAASAYPVGHSLAVVDESGAVSPTVVLTLTPQGSDKINGVTSLALTTAFSGVLLFSDGSSKWTAIALPAGTASNAVLYVQQSLTGGQQDQARANVGGAVAANQNATTTLTALDFDRDQFTTGTSTLTMPLSVAPGWRSGIILNDNAVTGLVTLAVPSGHSLDGVANGSTILFPFQRARLQLVAAGSWRTVWVDRVPVIVDGSKNGNIASAVTSADFNLPAGYSRFAFAISNVVMSATNVTLAARISDNGSAGIKSGASDYNNVRHTGNSNNASSAFYEVATWFTLGAQVNDNSGLFRTMVEGRLHPGGGGNQYPILSARTVERDSIPYADVINIGSFYNGATSGAMGRANLIRILAGSGTFTGNITIWGEP